MVAMLAMGGLFLLLAQYLQLVLGLTGIAAGLVMTLLRHIPAPDEKAADAESH